MKSVSIIRNRGQLTIPDNIRKKVNWANPMSPVTFTISSSDEIVIRPYKIQADKTKIWEEMDRIRSYVGKGKATSASEFLEADRKSH